MTLDFSDPTPLYKQIAKNIKSKINSDVYKIGDKIPSQRVLAEQYDVSMITVKKAISDLINEEILYSRVGKGTYVARKSRRTNLNDAKTIGLVLSDLKSPYFSLISHGVEMKASEEEYNLLLSNSSGKFEKEERLIHRFLDIGVDGLIIASMSHEYRANKTIRQLHADGYPCVVVSFIADDDIYRVGTDHKAGSSMATRHLIEHGYRNIGYINAEQGNILGELRLQGFEQAMEDAGLPVKDEFCYSYPYKGEWNDHQSGYEIGVRMLENEQMPEAVFVYNDLGALGLESALTEQGLSIPDDMGIIGFDDIERSSYCSVPLTTVRQPTERIGKLAVKKLVHLINGENPTVQTILKPRLIKRDSCGIHTEAEIAQTEDSAQSLS